MSKIDCDKNILTAGIVRRKKIIAANLFIFHHILTVKNCHKIHHILTVLKPVMDCRTKSIIGNKIVRVKLIISNW